MSQQQIRIPTVMRSAFDGITLRHVGPNAGKLVGLVMDGLRSKAGTVPYGKGWNARLSFKTAKKIGIEEGCTFPKARMAYDSMVNG
jgi:hypothetical protein